MIKNLYIYWGQKFNNAPNVVKNCLLSWKLKNPTWKIIELDDENLIEYVNLEEDIPNLKDKNITKTAYSDIVRIFLLEKIGGCWCDATTFCNQSLDNWLDKNIQSGFFGFDKPGPDRLLSSWFLYAEKNNYIVKKWKEYTIKYWNNNNEMHTYFWFHYLFNELYNSDDMFKKIWNFTPKISADEPHILQTYGLLNYPSDNIKLHIDTNKTPLYKLTYKYNEDKYNDNCVLKYLFDTNFKNIKLIHIGKCGGTSLMKSMIKSISEYHLNRNYCFGEKYLIWIRNPLKRFVSAFYYSYDLIHTDTSCLDKNNLSLDICLAPMRIHYKMTHDHTFSLRYDFLINYFQNPNNLAESITSNDETIKNLALELMNSEIEHIFKGIGWYLYNGNFVEENYDKILFVGSIENMNNDVLKLCDIFNVKINVSKIRENKNKNNLFLSQKAIENLLNFYKQTDYKALQKLVEFNFISNDLFEEYHYYTI